MGCWGRSASGAVGAIRLALAAAATIALGAVASPAALAAGCPNEAIREAQTSETLPNGTVHLPACMALEMVSPPKKFGQEATELTAFSPDGSRALFRSKAALADTEGLQSFLGDRYIASRGASGWTIAPTSPPHSAGIVIGGTAAGGPYAYASDLDAWVLFGGTQAQKMAGEGQIFQGAFGGAFGPLSPLLKPINDSGTFNIVFFANGFRPAGTAAALSATVFRFPLASTAFLAGDPRAAGEEEPGDINHYVAFLDAAGNPALELLARDEAGTVYGGLCGTRLGGGSQNQGAISPDGSRIYFSTRPAQPFDEAEAKGPPCDTNNPLRILGRVQSPSGAEITELVPGGPAGGDDLYQAASLDGSRVFFTSPRSLAASDVDTPAPGAQCGAAVGASAGCDLYLHDASLPPADRLIQVSAGGTGDPDPGQGANVLGTAAISPDGSRAYFVAQGVLTTTANPEGDVASAGQPNLYLYRRDAEHPGGHTAFIGTLVAGDSGELWNAPSFAGGASAVPMLGGGPEGGGDGHVLVLVSKASLTAGDSDGGRADVFRYESQAPALQCLSCIPGAGAFDVTAGFNQAAPSSNFAEQGRWASEDGQTVAFATAEALVPGDIDAAHNPYLWKEGQLGQLPGDMSKTSAIQLLQLPSLSAAGEEVGFSTTEPLLPQDGDTTRDVYLVRVGGGFPNPPPPVACDPLSEGACQGPSSTAPPLPGAATPSFVGPGNPKGPAGCRKGKVRKRGRCIKPGRRSQQQPKKKQAGNRRGGSR
jgi:WD40-like Beta Propeller Repeat